VIVLVVLIVVAIGSTAKKVSNDITNANKQAMSEVKITSCAADTLGDVEIEGTAHNTSSGRSDYLIEVVVDAKSGTQLDSSTAVADNVEARQTAQWRALTTAKYAAGVTCKVSTAIRHASLNP
jgi:hypothetical protein